MPGLRIMSAWVVVCSVVLAREPQAQEEPRGLTPDEAVARMVLPAGFHAEVFASEPEIRQPVAACFDERGRMWVIEYLQYPAPAGLKPVAVDQYLRTVYDRTPEPPPAGPRGADRVKILEDTDGDGRADRVTTFLDGLNLASGVAVGYGGVFVAQAPYLLFYPDRNRDDRPDSDPEVLLSGFGLEDAHAVVNSLTWGPDGWLYGAQGSTVTARIRGIEFQQGIWRYHPVTHEFELFAEGGGNTWGVDFDRQGRILGSSNSGFIAFHMVQGGNYWKGFAKHGPLHNPRAFGYFDSIAYDGPKQGGHVTPGGIIYKGDQFPSPFQGVFIGGNLLANTVYWHPLAERGSTLKGRFGGTLLDAHDTWFRPIDLLTGPEGCLYVVDWYDKRASHLDPRDNWDRSNGRIYRVVHGERPPTAPFDLAALSTAELVALRDRANDWWPETARRILWERGDQSAVARLLPLVKSGTDERLAMLDLWALDACGGLEVPQAIELLQHSLPAVRAWVVRRMGDRRATDPSLVASLLGLARTDPSAIVRSQLAATAQRLEPETDLDLVVALAAHESDRTDPFIPLQLWWATERVLRSDPEAVVRRLGGGNTALPLVQSSILERVASCLALDQRLDLLTRLVEQSAGPGEREAVVRGLELGWPARGRAQDGLAVGKFLEAVADARQRRRSGLVLGDRATIGDTWTEVREGRLPGDDAEIVRLLGRAADDDLRRQMAEFWGGQPASKVDSAWIDAISAGVSPDVGRVLLARYSGLPEALQTRVLGLLCARPDWARMLLSAVEAGQVQAADLKLSDLVQLGRHTEPELRAQLASLLSRLPANDASARARRTAQIRSLLPENDKGDTAHGHAVFLKTCSGCHRLFGEGKEIGPDLTGVERGNLDFLIESLVDPSRTIRKEYQPVTLALADGRVLDGLIIEENENTLVLFDSRQQQTRIPRSEVDEQRASTVSLMPEGVLDGLDQAEIRDLIRYLQSSGLPPGVGN